MLTTRAFITGFGDRFSTTIGDAARKESTTTALGIQSPSHISIVGGGLAGLSTAYHFLTKANNTSASVTIYDKHSVGKGGASSVAGGLLHPLSPRGNKVAHWGLEGLASTRRLVNEASKFVPECILREKLYRVALTEENKQNLCRTATEILPEHCRWMEQDEIDRTLGIKTSLGGVELFNGCGVIHVPSYLRGLLAACQEKGQVDWKITDNPADLRLQSSNERNKGPWIWACGAGVIQEEEYFEKTVREKFPLQIVRGQSIELTPTTTCENVSFEAALCGKYISPLPDKNRMLVGATHEFKKEALSPSELKEELRKKSYELAPTLWDNSTVHAITCGYRAQSQRGALGRVPMIGRTNDKDWIYTGLSNRGLLHHGIYGEKLVDMILASYDEENECPVTKQHPHLNWWKGKMS